MARSAIWALFCAIAICRFPGAGRDDVFLTLWSGETLGHRSWFVNYDNQYAEIASSLFHTVVIKLLSLVAPDGVFVLNKLVGLGFAVATIALLFRIRDNRPPDGATEARAFVAAFLTATSPIFAYWSLGGLETPLQAFFLLSYVMAAGRFHSHASASTAACLGAVACCVLTVRPEGFYVIPLTLLLLWWSGRASPRHAILAAGLPLVLALGLAYTRHLFTGLFFPNPVYAKVGDLRTSIPEGAVYLFTYWSRGVIGPLHFIVLVAAVFVCISTCLGERARVSFPLLAVASLTVIGDAFAFLTGGDWMEYFRFLAPVVPLKNLLLAEIVIHRGWIASIQRRVPRSAAVAGMVAITLAIGVQQQWISGVNPSRTAADNCSDTVRQELFRGSLSGLSSRLMQLNCAHRRDLLGIEPFIRRKMRQYLDASAGHLTIMTYQMGFFPYAVRREFPASDVEFVDTTGLSDPTIAALPVAKSLVGLAWHKDILEILRGERDGLSRYVAQRRPNMIYLLGADPAMRQGLAQLSFKLVWDRPGAVVFWRGDVLSTTD